MATVGGIKQKEGSENSLTVDELAQFAVNEHNNKANALIEFHRVVNAKEQVVSGTMYYITLEAKDGDKVKVYEAKVWVKPWMNFKEVQEFKYVGDAPADYSLQHYGSYTEVLLSAGLLKIIACSEWALITASTLTALPERKEDLTLVSKAEENVDVR
ncbi:hypothetical protein Cgig2_016135 [Carnegiea gigantea]|uniref:Cysteine proteinase inhibitor n=1 Tax=Carnegiea gigantea TaxID=171969 RepID=A0A9Q1KND6_9CARY|nr:hypothetical protein Cgig2_016135 [Carnegiea gigantea]